MICNGCGNPRARRIRAYEGGDEICDLCGGLGSVTLPDTYFREAYVDPHLIDPKKPEERNGVLISSKREKAERMKRLGVREAGDKQHGARVFDKFSAANAAAALKTKVKK